MSLLENFVLDFYFPSDFIAVAEHFEKSQFEVSISNHQQLSP